MPRLSRHTALKRHSVSWGILRLASEAWLVKELGSADCLPAALGDPAEKSERHSVCLGGVAKHVVACSTALDKTQACGDLCSKRLHARMCSDLFFRLRGVWHRLQQCVWILGLGQLLRRAHSWAPFCV